MMKSFFKKLAFVMALAMVVTLAAPAAQASAAGEMGIALQTATSESEVLASYTMKEGETEDFKYYGAPKNYLKLSPTWSSDNEAVATVDKYGVVTAEAAGTANIVIALSNGYTGSMAVTVEPIANTYTVKQINHNKVQLTFLDKVDFKAEDVTLNKMFDGEEVFWPIQNVKVDANTITFETYINYEDGEEYVVRVGADDEGTAYKTTIGTVTKVALAYGTSKDAKGNIVYANKAYTNGEDGDELTVYLSAKLYNIGGVDVTGYYSTADVVYELAEENEDIMIDNYSGELVFYKAGVPAIITATYTYYDAEGNQHDVKSLATPVISTQAPAYGIKSVDAWAIDKTNNGDYWKVNWNTHDIKAEDDVREGYQVVVKFTDTNGNQYITKSYGNLPWGLYYAEDSNYDFADKGNYVTFSSSNTNKLLVGENGELTTSDKATVAIILTLRNYDSEKEDFFVKNVRAFQLNVKEKRKISSVTLNNNATTVITNSNEPGFTKRTVEAYVLDQYNEKWYENVTLNLSSSVEGAPTLSAVTFNKGDKATITVDGVLFANLNKQTVSYTVKDAQAGKTATLKVVVKNPKIDDNAIKITSYSLAVNSVDMKSNSWDQWSTDDKSTTIHYYELSNSIEVGHRDNVTLITNAGDFEKITAATAKKGDQYVVIYDCNGKVVPASGGATTIASGSALVTELQDGEYKVLVAERGADKLMDYAPTGTYTVKVLEVRDFSKDVAVFRTKYEKSFNVSNNNPTLALKKQEKVDVTVAIDSKYFAAGNNYTYQQKMNAAINEVVTKAFKVTKGNGDWNFNASNIMSVDYKLNAGQDSVIIRSVTFKVPLETNGKWGGFYEYKLTINRAVDVTLISK